MDYIKKPVVIEETSMEIIEKEMKAPEKFTPHELKIIKRVIHTTADFEYEELISFTPGIIQALSDGVERKRKIYADTSMIVSGVNRKLLKKHNLEVVNFVHDEDVYREASERGITRSMAAVEKAFYREECDIWLIGNAPTALIRLLELCKKEPGRSPVIVGVPVGFVGAAESKELLMEQGREYITVRGRKGGSPVAAAIMNALLKIIEERV